MKKSLTCLMCGRSSSSLARCHIYPRAMSMYATGDDKLIAMSVANGPRVSVARGGLYDEEIVCGDCESKFHKADTYGIEFWRSLVVGNRPFSCPYGLKLRFYEADAGLLHTFCMQTLLKADLSSRWECNEIDLGQQSGPLAAAFFSGEETIDSGPEIALQFVKHPAAMGSTSPCKASVGDEHLYELRFPHLIAHIAVESKLPVPYQPFVLKRGAPVPVIHRKGLLQSEEQALMDVYERNAIAVARIWGE